jgi:hypothetical protein
MTRAVLQNDMAYSTTGDNKVLSDIPSGPPVGLQPSERVEQLDMTGNQSVGGQDRYPYHMNHGSDPAHQFDFNLSMLSTADDSYDFGFLPDDTNGWPTPMHGGGNVYSKLQARPHRSSTHVNTDPVSQGITTQMTFKQVLLQQHILGSAPIRTLPESGVWPHIQTASPST